MRTIFMAGGFVGFALVALAGAFVGRGWQFIFRDAAIGCLLGAFLFRWMWSVYLKALAHAIQSKRAQRMAAEEAEAAARVPRSPLVGAGGKN
jgi:hypothetical protein